MAELQTKHLVWIAACTGVAAILAVAFWRKRQLHGLDGSIVLPFLKPRKGVKAQKKAARDVFEPPPDEDIDVPPDDSFVPPDEDLPSDQEWEEIRTQVVQPQRSVSKRTSGKRFEDPNAPPVDPNTVARIRAAFDLVQNLAEKHRKGSIARDEEDQLCMPKAIFNLTGNKTAAEKHDPVLCESYCLKAGGTGGICVQDNDAKTHCVCMGMGYNPPVSKACKPKAPSSVDTSGKKQLYRREPSPKTPVNEGAE